MATRRSRADDVDSLVRSRPTARSCSMPERELGRQMHGVMGCVAPRTWTPCRSRNVTLVTAIDAPVRLVMRGNIALVLQTQQCAVTAILYVSRRRQFCRDDDPDPDVPRDCYAWRWPPMGTGRFPVPLRLEQPSTPLREPPAVMPMAQPAKFPGVAQLDVSHFAKLLPSW
jgi:hypothetical protein